MKTAFEGGTTNENNVRILDVIEMYLCGGSSTKPRYRLKVKLKRRNVEVFKLCLDSHYIVKYIAELFFMESLGLVSHTYLSLKNS